MAIITASDAISLLGFYLALVALLTSIFFTRLEGWYNDARLAVRLWDEEDKENLPIQKTKDHKKEVVNLQNSMPILGFLFVLAFIASITYFSIKLMSQISESGISLTFIWLPGAIFELIFLGGSLYLFRDGKTKLDSALIQIDIALNPKKK